MLIFEHESLESLESLETKQHIRVIRAIRVPKKMCNSRAEKYLLLRSLVRTVAATRVSVQIRELKIGG